MKKKKKSSSKLNRKKNSIEIEEKKETFYEHEVPIQHFESHFNVWCGKDELIIRQNVDYCYIEVGSVR